MEEEIDKNVGRDMTPRLIGETYMKYPTEKSSRKYRYGLYECQYCDKEWETTVYSIKSGTKSCGCLLRRGNISHGFKLNRFYSTWSKMLYRCNNPKHKGYKNYGGRGITVCVEWLDIATFIAWCNLTHPNIEGYTLDRINNDKGYSPDNCRWANSTIQNINKRMMKNNTSGFVGVSWDRATNKWRVNISMLKRNRCIGYYEIIEEAIQARDNYIVENNLPHKLSTDYKRKELK